MELGRLVDDEIASLRLPAEDHHRRTEPIGQLHQGLHTGLRRLHLLGPQRSGQLGRELGIRLEVLSQEVRVVGGSDEDHAIAQLPPRPPPPGQE